MSQVMLHPKLDSTHRRVVRDAKGNEKKVLVFEPGVPVEIKSAADLQAVAPSVGPSVVLVTQENKGTKEKPKMKTIVDWEATEEAVLSIAQEMVADNAEAKEKGKPAPHRLRPHQETALREYEEKQAAKEDRAAAEASEKEDDKEKQPA